MDGLRSRRPADGAPFSTSWLQLQLMKPGQRPSASYAGRSHRPHRRRRRRSLLARGRRARARGGEKDASRSSSAERSARRARVVARLVLSKPWSRSARWCSCWSSTSSCSGSRATGRRTCSATASPRGARGGDRGTRPATRTSFTQFRIYVEDTRPVTSTPATQPAGRPRPRSRGAAEHDPAGRHRHDPLGADRHLARRRRGFPAGQDDRHRDHAGLADPVFDARVLARHGADLAVRVDDRRVPDRAEDRTRAPICPASRTDRTSCSTPRCRSSC